jgi:hypothetical protein
VYLRERIFTEQEYRSEVMDMKMFDIYPPFVNYSFSNPILMNNMILSKILVNKADTDPILDAHQQLLKVKNTVFKDETAPIMDEISYLNDQIKELNDKIKDKKEKAKDLLDKHITVVLSDIKQTYAEIGHNLKKGEFIICLYDKEDNVVGIVHNAESVEQGIFDSIKAYSHAEKVRIFTSIHEPSHWISKIKELIIKESELNI